MQTEIIVNLISGLVSLLGFGAISSDLARPFLRAFLRRKAPPKTYAEQLESLTEKLTQSSREVDAVLADLARVTRDRANAVKQLELDLAALEGRQKELKEKIDLLEKIPLPVAEHFAKLIEPSEKRNAMRDYLLFGAGVVVSTLIAVVLQIVKR